MNSALAEGAAKAPDGADYEARHISVLLLLQVISTADGSHVALTVG